MVQSPCHTGGSGDLGAIVDPGCGRDTLRPVTREWPETTRLGIKIPLSRVHQSEAIDRRILEVVKSGNYILGAECSAFAREFADYIGVKHLVLASSWTAAVHLLHIAQGLKPGDEILVPSLTAFPSVEPMIHVGAKPIFCDVDETLTIDVEDARKRITDRTVGILPVHLYGRPANLDAVMEVASERGLWVLEDCAQSHGARWRGKRTGSFGRYAAFSFYPSKNLTVYGDGGAVACEDAKIIEMIQMLQNHGRREGGKYFHEEVGYNQRFNEIQAAIGREQLKVLDDLNDGRRRAADWYRRELSSIDSVTLPPADKAGETESVYHMFVIRLKSHEQREGLARALKEQGIQTGVHYPVPIHQQPAITRMHRDLPRLPRTEEYCRKVLSLPMFPSISEQQVLMVCNAIRQYLRKD